MKIKLTKDNFIHSILIGKLLLGLCISSLLAGCSTHVVDTFPEWCEQIQGVDITKKHAPWWAIFPAVKFDAEAIRNDFTFFLDNAYREKAKGRIDKMAWRTGTSLHIENLSTFLVIESEEFIDEYKQKVEAYWDDQLEDKADECVFGTIATMFDEIVIHSGQSDSLGKNWTETTTKVDTLRKEKLKDKAL